MFKFFESLVDPFCTYEETDTPPKEISNFLNFKYKNQPIEEIQKNIQQDIFNISGDISLPDSDTALLSLDRIDYLEEKIKEMSNDLPPLKEFILPGGSEFNSRLHIARTTCRNSERSLVAMHQKQDRNDLHAKYLNRLSDYLFLLARVVGLKKNQEEEHWELKK